MFGSIVINFLVRIVGIVSGILFAMGLTTMQIDSQFVESAILATSMLILLMMVISLRYRKTTTEKNDLLILYITRLQDDIKNLNCELVRLNIENKRLNTEVTNLTEKIVKIQNTVNYIDYE